jgi:hypothetical protein
MRVKLLAIAGMIATVAALATTLPANAATSQPTRQATVTAVSPVVTGQISGGTVTVQVVKGDVKPDSASGCVGNLSFNNVQTCVALVGKGLSLTFFGGSSYVKSSTIVARGVLDGKSIYYHSKYYILQPGDTLLVWIRWKHPHKVKAGQYCYETQGLHNHNYGRACETVHR